MVECPMSEREKVEVRLSIEEWENLQTQLSSSEKELSTIQTRAQRQVVLVQRAAATKVEELIQEVVTLERRIEGLREAVGRWQRRAQGEDTRGDEDVIIKTEIVRTSSNDSTYWLVLEHYQMSSAPADPTLWAEVVEDARAASEDANIEKWYTNRQGWVKVRRAAMSKRPVARPEESMVKY